MATTDRAGKIRAGKSFLISYKIRVFLCYFVTEGVFARLVGEDAFLFCYRICNPVCYRCFLLPHRTQTVTT